MANWIEGVKCINNISCSLSLSFVLSLALIAHITFAGETKDMTSDQYWTLVIFYGGAIVFLMGCIASYLSNGYVVMAHLVCAIFWLALIGGLSFYRMSSRDISLYKAFMTIIDDVTMDRLGTWITIFHWALGISVAVTLGCAGVMTFHFIQYKYI